MSENSDQPVVDAPIVGADAGVDAAAAATTTTNDDIETEAFDRMEAPDDDDAEAGDGDPAEVVDPDKPTAEAEDPETIEVEVAGQKYKVPKALEGELLRQADYTRKTQELAEQRRLVDTEAETLAATRAQQVESLKAFRAEHMTVASHEASIVALDTDLAKYRAMTAADWTNLRASDPATYTAHSDNYEFLKRTRGASEDALTAAKADLTSKETALAESQTAVRKEALSKAWQGTNATLAAKIEGWTPAKGQEIAKFMVEQLGATPEELPEATDPRIWLMTDEIMRNRVEIASLKANQKQATATETALKSQTVTPAVKPAGGGAKPTGVNDGLSTEEWLRRRNAQVAKRGR